MIIKNYRRPLSILIIAAFLIFPKTIIAQNNCNLATATEVLEGNNIKALIPANGNLFWTIENDNQFQIATSPTPPFASSFFTTGIWVGAMNDTDQLRIAAATYSTNTRYDYVAGPILNDNGQLSYECGNYDQLWEVFGYEINAHLDDWNDNGTVDNPLINIYGYPAHQNPHFEGIYGFELPNTPQGLAPFFDENSDGIYNPDDGDFPLPEAVSVDRIPAHIIWGVFNDGGTNHLNTGGEPLNIEVQQTAWSFYCDDNELLNNSIFTTHKIINRGTETLDDLTVSKWVDFDLGCYTDDYMGSIPDLNTFYAYNEDPVDGSVGTQCDQGVSTFGENPPVQAVTFLNKTMTSLAVLSNGSVGIPNPATTDPTQPDEFYNYMQGIWRDGAPFTVGGSGYGGTQTTSFMFPDNPNDLNGWSMYASNLPFGDRRSVGSVKFDDAFAPGSVVSVDLAYTFYQDENLDNVESINLIYDNTPMLQQMYDDGFGASCTYTACLDDCVWTGDADKDSIVTPFDILQVGQAYGEEGTSRNKPLTWQPFAGDNWINNVNGTNLKHTDCNGDAVINEADFFFVDQYFDHSYKTGSVIDEYPLGPELTVLSHPSSVISIDTLTPNEMGFAQIFLLTTEDIYGLAMTVEVDTEYLKIENIIGGDSPWESGLDNTYGWEKNQIDEGEAHYVFTKTDGINSISEEGMIMRLQVRAQTTDFMLVESVIRIKNIKAILADGTDLDFGAQSFIVQLFNADGDGTVLNNENLEVANINVFPNPATDILNIKMDDSPSHISIFDAYGKNVFEKTSGLENQMQLPISHFSSGIYFVKIRIKGREFVQKIIKL